MNDTTLKQVNAKPIAIKNVKLYPGEGVYSLANSQPSISGQGENIKNAYLSSTTIIGAWAAGSSLLSYNANEDDSGIAEDAFTTGAAVSASITMAGRSTADYFTGSYKIDARDMLRQNGNNRLDTGILQLSRRSR
jgi:hypothetical protein